MARGIEKLKAPTLSRKLKRGYYGDGGGLYLQVGTSGSRSWVFRYRQAKRLREMGLGSFNTVSLTLARDLARDCRRQLQKGLDPLQVRKEAHLAAQVSAAQSMTFKECAEAYIAAHKPAWGNDKHQKQWSATLSAYAYPIFGQQSVGTIDIALMLKVLSPIWSSKPETASRLRGRIEAILDWATVQQLRTGSNPARWKGRLDKLLPAQARIAKVKPGPGSRIQRSDEPLTIRVR